MTNKGQLNPGGVPAHVIAVLASGERMSAKQITQALSEALRDRDGYSVYASVATALTEFSKRGLVQREKVRGKFVYWRPIINEAAAS